MKILMVGEFSGFYSNLKIGFERLGHTVTLISNKDGWKNIGGTDIIIKSSLPSVLGAVSEKIQYVYRLAQFDKCDAVLIVNPNIGIRYVSRVVSQIISRKSKNVFLSACGTDVEYVNYGDSGAFDYWPFDDVKQKPVLSQGVHENLLKVVRYIIPTHYDYAVAWRQSKYSYKLTKTIPLPIDVTSIKPEYSNGENKKITFFHGINSVSKKGTVFIREALENVKKKYPNDVEIIINDPMPISDYLSAMLKADVIVDQCKVYSYGSMNSLYALSMGKVLLAGFRDECKAEYSISSNVEGIIHIEPDVQKIESAIEHVLKNKTSLEAWGKNNRSFVESTHSCEHIAKKYLEIINV